MKRSHLIYGIVYTCIGVAFLLLALFTEYRLESLFWGLPRRHAARVPQPLDDAR